jgi:hypothetical protein
MIHDREAETMDRGLLEELQSERLRALVRYVYERVPFYRRRFGGELLEVDPRAERAALAADHEQADGGVVPNRLDGAVSSSTAS